MIPITENSKRNAAKCSFTVTPIHVKWMVKQHVQKKKRQFKCQLEYIIYYTDVQKEPH